MKNSANDTPIRIFSPQLLFLVLICIFFQFLAQCDTCFFVLISCFKTSSSLSWSGDFVVITTSDVFSACLWKSNQCISLIDFILGFYGCFFFTSSLWGFNSCSLFVFSLSSSIGLSSISLTFLSLKTGSFWV